MSDEFIVRLVQELLASAHNFHEDNWDPERFGPKPEPPHCTLTERIRGRLARMLLGAGPVRMVRQEALMLQPFLLGDFSMQAVDGLSYLYDRLADDQSRRLLVQTMAYRILGPTKVKLPLNTPQYWAGRESMSGLITGDERIETGFMGWKLQRFGVDTGAGRIGIFLTPLAVYNRFFLRSYELAVEGHTIKAAPGDVVLDLGGCWGDTALYFANEVGPKGKVYTFEFLPKNLSILRRNLGLNPELAPRVDVVENPVWEQGGKMLYYLDNGPGSKVSDEPVSSEYVPVSTVSVDGFVHERGLKRVDFIKMDIEGAEPWALRGCAATIKAHKPRLAISLYHALSDFGDVPRIIDSLGVKYRYHLGHFTIHSEETVLFAEPEAEG